LVRVPMGNRAGRRRGRCGRLSRNANNLIAAGNGDDCVRLAGAGSGAQGGAVGVVFAGR
jgi:hypothetical protein